MLSINLTFFVQIANFLVAWLLFDRIFLRVGYAEVMREERLKADILKEQEAAKAAERERESWLTELQHKHTRTLSELMPPQRALDRGAEMLPELHAVEITPETEQTYRTNYKKSLIEVVTRGMGHD